MKKPNSRRNLDMAIQRLFNDSNKALQVRRYMANIIAAQMLPECVIKGGVSLKLRFGDASTRFSTDLDTARKMNLNLFLDELSNNLNKGWDDFSGRLIKKNPAQPKNVPTQYVMQPFEIKLEYNNKPWITIPLEVGFNEIEDAEEADYIIPEDAIEIFKKLGFPEPKTNSCHEN